MSSLPRIVPLLVAILCLCGCDGVLTTSQLPPVHEDAILGEWKDLGIRGSTPDPDPVWIRSTNGEYSLGSAAQFEKGEATPFTLSRAGGALIVQTAGKDQCVPFGVEKGLPCWSLNRVEILHDQLNWYEFDVERMGRDSFSGALNVAQSVHRKLKKDGNSDNAILIPADGADLKMFLDSYVKRPMVFRLTGRLQRAPRHLQ